MAMFKDKRAVEDKEKEDLQKFAERYQLESLSEDDVKELYEVRRTSNFSVFEGIIEQNFILIKMLNKINQSIVELKNK